MPSFFLDAAKPFYNVSRVSPFNKTPPTVLELKPFEEDVIKLLETITFRDKKDYFQDTLANDLKKINSSDKMFVFADKTRNIYETSLNTYDTYDTTILQKHINTDLRKTFRK